MIGLWKSRVTPNNLWWYCNRYNLTPESNGLDFTEVCEHVCLGVRITR